MDADVQSDTTSRRGVHLQMRAKYKLISSLDHKLMTMLVWMRRAAIFCYLISIVAILLGPRLIVGGILSNQPSIRADRKVNTTAGAAWASRMETSAFAK